ncbi:MAG: CidA/LrgA family protein [Roseburia sp.]|nr:CidA/LrgA family protein [Roseburia sp.]
MKYIRQFLIILGFSFMGELLKELIPLSIPASIYGLVLLFAALELGVIKVEAIRDTGKFLIEIMPVMFIPAGAGLVDSWDALKPIFVSTAVILAVSTVIVMAVSGRTAQFVIRRRKENAGKKGGAEHE